MYDAHDWTERSNPGRQQTEWNAASPQMWTPPHGLMPTPPRFEDVTEQSDVEVQQLVRAADRATYPSFLDLSSRLLLSN